jgi:hypothetical protein
LSGSKDVLVISPNNCWQSNMPVKL